jgi:hydroxymethylpyrimidine/phosphomethylpyrimidine kinase
VARVSCVLVFAGLDPSGGAGLLADAETVRAFGLRPLCVATALTVQTASRALRFEAVSPALVLESARALLAEEDVAAVKIGMIGSGAVGRAILAALEGARVPIVLDPVLAASSGAALLEPGGLPALLDLLQGAVVTPNAPEAHALLGLQEAPRDADALEAAGRALLARGARAAVLKGGHLEGEAVDVVVSRRGDGNGVEVLRLGGARLAGTKRGTGCRFATALACGLSGNQSVADAARGAKEHVRNYLERP